MAKGAYNYYACNNDVRQFIRHPDPSSENVTYTLFNTLSRIHTHTGICIFLMVYYTYRGICCQEGGLKKICEENTS